MLDPRRTAVLAFLFVLVAASGLGNAQQSGAPASSQADLAKAAQNPVAAMISPPFQNNVLFGVGPDDNVANVANVLNIQPVIPVFG